MSIRELYSVFKITFILLLSVYFLEVISITNHGLEVVWERAEVLYVDEKYVKNGKATVRRSGRKSPYVLNFEGDLQQQWTNNVSVSVILYEYLHNEYKRSFIEFHFKLCDLIDKDDFIGNRLRAYNVTCPFQPGHWNLTNARIIFPFFPYLSPFKRAKAALALNLTATGEAVALANIYVYIKQV